MKDRFLGLLTTIALLALPGTILLADQSDWARRQILTHAGWTWAAMVGLLVIVGILLGIEKRGSWDGLLIDPTNRKSLSRLQAIIWGTILLSGITAAFAINVARDCAVPPQGTEAAPGACTESAWDLHIPEQVLILAGLSAGTLGLAAVTNASNAVRTMNTRGIQSSQKAGLLLTGNDGLLGDVESDAAPPNAFYGVIVGKDVPEHSSFSDIVKGDIGGSAAYIDLSRTQHLIFTIVLAGSYAVFLLQQLRDPVGAVAFPAFDAGLNVILGLSITAYLGVKAMTGVAASE